MSSDYNIRIFNDTLSKIKENKKLDQAVQSSINNQILIEEEDALADLPNMKMARMAANLFVSEKRTLKAASFYRGKRIAVLNFADAYTPGGLVKYGAHTQEEGLCRISTLYPCITDKKNMRSFYQKHCENQRKEGFDDIIFTPGVIVFRSDDGKMNMLDENDWYSVDVITCAAPENMDGSIDDEKLRLIQEKRVNRILYTAAMNQDEVVILGAFGCGAFGNDPMIVADVMNKAAHAYSHVFETIEFAVFCSNDEKENYWIFKRMIG